MQLPVGLRTGFVLPSAAAAALVVSATGATVVQSSPALFDLTGSMSRTLAEDAAAAQYARIDAQQQRELQAGALPGASGFGGSSPASTATAAGTGAVQRIARSADRTALAKQTAAAAAARQRAAAALAASQRWVMPIQGATFTSGFGWRWGRMHQGNDFGTPVGTPVAAMSTGTVVSTGYESGYGNQVEIRYWDGTVSLYAHLSEIKASVGEVVTPGQIVALSGNTGHSTGPHLHLEIHPNGGAPINPAPWLHAHHLQ